MTDPGHPRRATIETAAATTAAWVLALAFAFFGATKLAAADAQVAMFQGWGYPLWFMYTVGAAELTAAILLLSRKTAFYGATLVAALMFGGIATHALAGEIMQLWLPAMTLTAAGLVATLRRPAPVAMAWTHTRTSTEENA